jgi:hypothetical protein
MTFIVVLVLAVVILIYLRVTGKEDWMRRAQLVFEQSGRNHYRGFPCRESCLRLAELEAEVAALPPGGGGGSGGFEKAPLDGVGGGGVIVVTVAPGFHPVQARRAQMRSGVAET